MKEIPSYITFSIVVTMSHIKAKTDRKIMNMDFRENMLCILFIFYIMVMELRASVAPKAIYAGREVHHKISPCLHIAFINLH